MSKKTILVVSKFICNMHRLLQPGQAHFSDGGEDVRMFVQETFCKHLFTQQMSDVKILKSSSSDNDLVYVMIWLRFPIK